MKLTDTDALRKAVLNDPLVDGKTYARVMYHIISAQREDALPIVHGLWKNGFCSVCGEEAITEWNECGGKPVYSNYCPYCGATMDLEEKK